MTGRETMFAMRAPSDARSRQPSASGDRSLVVNTQEEHIALFIYGTYVLGVASETDIIAGPLTRRKADGKGRSDDTGHQGPGKSRAAHPNRTRSVSNHTFPNYLIELEWLCGVWGRSYNMLYIVPSAIVKRHHEYDVQYLY